MKRPKEHVKEDIRRKILEKNYLKFKDKSDPVNEMRDFYPIEKLKKIPNLIFVCDICGGRTVRNGRAYQCVVKECGYQQIFPTKSDLDEMHEYVLTREKAINFILRHAKNYKSLPDFRELLLEHGLALDLLDKYEAKTFKASP